MDIQQFLQVNDACLPARGWADGKSFQEIWETCDRADWLIWLLKRLDFPTRTFQELGILFAESVAHLMPDESKRAVADLRSWLNGEQVDLIKVRKSAHAACAVANSSRAACAAARAAYAAYAAVAVADAARYAADAAEYAARAANAALASSADIMRNNIPIEQVAQAAQKVGIIF